MNGRGLLLAVLLLLPAAAGATNPYAPNVFDEVERGTPGYRQAAALIDGGYATGIDASLLAREHLTRRELARALAAALANPAAASIPHEEATREYARELDAIGVVRADEQPGGIRVGGDVRIRYQDDGDEGQTDARARVNLAYEIR